jgi:hypothetical protein
MVIMPLPQLYVLHIPFQGELCSELVTLEGHQLGKQASSAHAQPGIARF